jgi:predicted secreted hydrolase
MNKFLYLISIVCSLTACSKSKAPSNYNLSALSNPDTKGFERAFSKRKFIFPQDHLPHENFRTEWWYFTGNLIDKKSKIPFSYQLTIFRQALKPPTNKANSLKQVWMGHLAITDIQDNKFFSYEILEREDLALAGLKNKPIEIFIDDWRIIFKDEKYFLSAKHQDIELDLELEPMKAIVLQGDEGLSQKSAEPGNASYYYSITRLKTTGQIKIKSNSYDVAGLSWFDREWSTSALAKDQAGWDWFSLQLDNDTEIMIYQLRNKDNSIDDFSSAAIFQGSNKINLKQKDFVIKVLKYWTSPEGLNLPAEWQIEIPSRKISLKLSPRINDQLHRFNISYWEGSVAIAGSYNGKKISGYGFAELTGY